MEFDEVNQMKLVVGLLVGADPHLYSVHGFVDASAAGFNFHLEILRIKNRFSCPTDAGWADTLINFRFRADPASAATAVDSDADPYWHVCEIQLVHTHMALVRRRMGAHHSYSKFRSAMELLEALGGSDQNSDGNEAPERGPKN